MKFGIIGAMEEEIALLRDSMENVQETTIARMTFYDGTIGGTPATVVYCFMGKVNAGVATQVLIERFDATHIIFTGVAGSLDSSIDIGDIVISTDCVQHDINGAGLGHEPGVNPDINMLAFEADSALRAAALEAAKATCTDIQVFEGRVATGDQFINDNNEKNRIVTMFGAICCEMEGGAVAQVAWLFDVPYVVIRAISDKADEDGGVDFRSFLEASSKRCASLVKYMIEHTA